MTVAFESLLAAKRRLLAAEANLFTFINAQGGLGSPTIRALLAEMSEAEAHELREDYYRWQERGDQA